MKTLEKILIEVFDSIATKAQIFITSKFMKKEAVYVQICRIKFNR